MAARLRAHLAVEHLISRNIVQLHSEKVIPGDGKQRAIESEWPSASTAFRELQLEPENQGCRQRTGFILKVQNKDGSVKE